MATPLLFVESKENGIKLDFCLDYIKALLDYNVNDNLPGMTLIEMKKMVNFFACDETVVKNRPVEMGIENIEVLNAHIDKINFTVTLLNVVSEEKEIKNLIKIFTLYFDTWMKKFVMMYGKYTKASYLGKLEEFTK